MDPATQCYTRMICMGPPAGGVPDRCMRTILILLRVQMTGPSGGDGTVPGERGGRYGWPNTTNKDTTGRLGWQSKDAHAKQAFLGNRESLS